MIRRGKCGSHVTMSLFFVASPSSGREGTTTRSERIHQRSQTLISSFHDMSTCQWLFPSQMACLYRHRLLPTRLPPSNHLLPRRAPQLTLSDPNPNDVYRSVCSSLPNSDYHTTCVGPWPRCPLLSPSVPNTCWTHAFFSQFARLVRSPSSVSSKSTHTGRTVVSSSPSIALETCLF